MSETRFTPGPWVLYSSGLIGTTAIRNGGKCYISTAKSGRTDEEDAANAEFIVRACNAHDDLLAIVRELATSMPYISGDNPRWNELFDEARAALAKATVNP